MAGKLKEYSNIRTFKKRNKQFNIGLLIFGVIFIYLIVTVFTYLTKNHVIRYEVREGSILKDNSYSGLVLREEIIIPAATGGYLNYYAAEGSKVAVGQNIYTISEEKIPYDENVSQSEEAVLDQEDTAQFLMQTQNFVESYDPNRFSETYSLKTGLESILQSNSSIGKQMYLDSLIQGGSIAGLSLFQTPDDGIIQFSQDGYEGLTAEQVTLDHLQKKDYSRQEFMNNQKVQAGDPVCRLITSESWQIVTVLSADTAKTLLESEANTVKLKMLKDNENIWAGIRIEKKDGAYFAYLTFDHSMIRYAGDRYLDFELILEDQSGLKIPKSAVVEKKFYIVPTEYITESGKTNESGVLKEKKKNTTEFVAADVYYANEEEGISYLEQSLFEKGDVILEPESQDTYVIGKTKTLKGVYNVNKGYAVFKQIHVLAESEEYYVIQSGSAYGLSNYDQIALYGDTVRENEIVLE
ncbi:HlyD family efflux transporter periplasmic adaptor subunit [Coprococcus sp. AF21-14LB]|uniref:HlyD family efflux transporter periplasmic adaptor subunit n=1 Tax=Coprococcus sp. AF21-14LB TaxID=2292231 RepID=UPI000E4D9418|nr:HlyD family efflux transporter periplasmic adaptor subunit [Coprococcus sp. AF21-14LB]RGS80346.1 hypothetical protein DWX73_05645 [Coprococcus sp. AF21-14LB]